MSPFRFLAFITTLLFSPIILPCDYSGDPEMQSKKTNCIRSSKEWNCQLNRCMTTAEAVETREEFQQCQQLTDTKSREECFLKLAEKKTGIKRGENNKKDGLETLSVGVSAAYALMGAIAWASKSGGSCLSKKIMLGGSVAHLVTHFLILKKSKKKFDNIAERAKSDGNDYNAQLRAFHLLKEEQQAIKKYAKRKKTTYTIVAAAYGGALAVAIMEKTGTLKLKPCSSGESEESKENTSVFKGALNINSSKKVAIYSGIGMLLAFKLRQKASEEEKKAERNIKHIDKIIAQFKDSIADFCPTGREDLKQPRCYCYTDKGEPNPNRTKSSICQNLWKQDNLNYAVEANTYRKKEGGLIGCMNLNGKFDPDCECRKYKNTATKKNLCMKTSQHIVIPSPLKDNLSGVATALKAADVLTGASSNKANLNDTALNKAAIQTKRYAEKLLKQYNRLAPKHQAPPIPLSPSFVKRAVSELVDAKMQKRFGSGLKVAPLGSNNRNISPPLSKAIMALNQKKSSLPQYQKKSNLKRPPKKQKKSSSPWPIDISSPSTKGKIIKIGKKPPLYHKAKNAALNTNPSTSIWKIISNRYLISGIPQLFKEKQ